MMQEDYCDVCGQIATHFFTTAQCFSDGRSESNGGRKFCEVQAVVHEQSIAREMLDSMLCSWRALGKFARSTDFIEIVFHTADEGDAAQSAGELGRRCGGVGTVADGPDGWTVTWLLAASALDQWQCEGWSQRVMEIVRGGTCKLSGFALRVERA
jgi:hypothetical protein